MSLALLTRIKPIAISAALGLFMAGASQAQADDVPVESMLTAFEVTMDETGTEHLGAASEILPGGVIEYHLEHVNHTDTPLGAFIIEGNVPDAAAYIVNSQSAEAASIFEARAAGTDWSIPPLVRYIEDEAGVMRPETIPASEYAAIRWRLNDPLEPEARIETVYRVRIDQ